MQAIRHFQNDSPEMSESKQFAAAMIILSAKARIYWRLVVMSDVIWTTQVPTAATDGIYIYINPAFFLGLPSDSQRAFLLGHEVGHMILKHPQRGKAFRKRGYFRVVNGMEIPFSHRLYNCAGDYVINADLVAHGLEPIECGLFDDRFTRNHLVDEVYAELYEDQQDEEDQQDDDGDDDDGEEAGDDTADESTAEDSEESDSDDSSEGEDDTVTQPCPDSETDGDDDYDGDDDEQSGGEQSDDEQSDDEQSGTGSEGTEHDGHDVHLEPQYEGTDAEIEEAEKEDERLIDKATEDGAEQQREAIEDGDHQDVGFGDGIGERLKASANRMSAPITWRDQIPDLLQRSGKGSEVSFAKIHRRRFNLYGVVSPVTKGALNQIAFEVDVSWSVDRNALRECMHVLADAIDELQPSGGAVVVFCGDSYVDHAEVFSGAELLDLEIPDGGGTYMTAGIKWLEENGYDPDVTLVFTDAEMHYHDMQYVVDSGAVIVLDGEPDRYVRQLLEDTNARVITVADKLIAA